MLKTTLRKLFLCSASCVLFSAVGMGPETIINTLSPDFKFVVTVDRPCGVQPDSTFQVVYTMRNNGSTPINRQEIVPGFAFPAVLTIIQLSGAAVVDFQADSGTEFDEANGRWQLTQSALAPNQAKQLTLTFQVENSPSTVNFFVEAAPNNFQITCQEQISIPVVANPSCPVSDITTLNALVSTFNVPASITFPNKAFVDQEFTLAYNITNNQAVGNLSEPWVNIFPLLENEEGMPLFEIVSIDVSPGSAVDTDVQEYPPGRGQGVWELPLIPPGGSAFLTITLRPTAAAVGMLGYITRIEGNPPCTFGPIAIEVTFPPDNPDGPSCPILPPGSLAALLASLLSSPPAVL